MPGLVGLYNDQLNQAAQGADQSAQMEAERNYQNMQIRAAQKQKEGTGMGMGAAIGFSAGGPVGALIGAGLGFLSGRLF